MNIKIELTYEQWDTLTGLVEKERDMWAVILAETVIREDGQDAINRRAEWFSRINSLHDAVYRNSEDN